MKMRLNILLLTTVSIFLIFSGCSPCGRSKLNGDYNLEINTKNVSKAINFITNYDVSNILNFDAGVNLVVFRIKNGIINIYDTSGELVGQIPYTAICSPNYDGEIVIDLENDFALHIDFDRNINGIVLKRLAIYRVSTDVEIAYIVVNIQLNRTK